MAKRLSTDEVRSLFKKKSRSDEGASTGKQEDGETRRSDAGAAGVLGGQAIRVLSGCGISKKRQEILEGILRGFGARILKENESLSTERCTLVVSDRISEIELFRLAGLSEIPKQLRIVTDEWVAVVSTSKQVPIDGAHSWAGHRRMENSDDAHAEVSQSQGSIIPVPPAPAVFVPQGSTRVSIGDRSVDAFGMGTLALGVLYPDPAARPSREESIRIVQAALRSGTEFFDAADSYGKDGKDFNYVEKLLQDAMRGHSEQAGAIAAVVATKGGMLRVSRESNGWRPSACRPDDLYKSIRASWQALGGAQPIFLWQLHHPNEKATPLEVSLQGAKRAVEEGLVRHVGLCNVTLEQIKRARAMMEIVSVQNEFSLWTRTAERNGVLEYCQREGLAFIAHGCLGGVKARRGERKVEQAFPTLKAMADRKGVSVHALILALTCQRWSGCMIHIPGCRRIERVHDVAAARGLRFTPAELAVLDGLKATTLK